MKIVGKKILHPKKRTFKYRMDNQYLIIILSLSLVSTFTLAFLLLRSSQKISKREETLRMLKKALKTTNIGITISDMDRRIIFTNPSEADMHGYSVEELIGKDVRIFAPKELACNPPREHLEKAKTQKGESVNLKKDGTSFPVLLTSDIVKDDKGKPLAFISVCEDITERKKQELELTVANEMAEAANRVKSDFIANMSHELRTPLNSIIGFTEIMIKGMTGEIAEAQRELLEDVHESGLMLLALINDILDISKIESSSLSLDCRNVDPKLLMDKSFSFFKAKALKKNLKLETEVDVNAGLIYGDEIRIKQVIINLVGNAVKFTPEGGTIKVSSKASGEKGAVEFAVTDTGEGIIKEDFETIFHPFNQLDSVLTKRHEGVGIGLALCREIVDMHNGKIWVESEVGVGSKFSFTIPLAEID